MEGNQGPIRVLLVDDHAVFRESVARVLGAEPGFEIEHCGSLREAFDILAQRQFEVILLDHDLGSERASHFLPAARQAGIGGRVLVVTAWVSDTEARRLVHQGVSGIFLKHAPLSALLESIRTVAAGGSCFDSSFGEAQKPAAAGEAGVPMFDDKERRVLRLLIEGLSNKDIAFRLRISESYVKAILQDLFQKTGVRTRGQLVRVAFEQYDGQL